MKHIDGRAILHIAGERRIGEMQKCIRCKCVISRDLEGHGWSPDALIASFGRGDWSLVTDTNDPKLIRIYHSCGPSPYRYLADDEYRPCKAKGREAIDLQKWEAMGGKA